MRQRPTTKPNFPSAIVCKAPWRVAKVEPLEDFKLSVEFVDGVQGLVLMKAKIFKPDAGVFAVLQDVDLFNQVYVHYGAVTWPGDLDLAPDAMHDEIKANGSWVLS